MQRRISEKEKKFVREMNHLGRLADRYMRRHDAVMLAEAIFKFLEKHGYGAVKYNDCYRFASFAEKTRIAAIQSRVRRKRKVS